MKLKSFFNEFGIEICSTDGTIHGIIWNEEFQESGCPYTDRVDITRSDAEKFCKINGLQLLGRGGWVEMGHENSEYGFWEFV